MTTNTLLTDFDITYECLRILKSSLAIGSRCIRDFDGRFGVEGAKIGNQLRVRVPPRLQVTAGPGFTAQNSTESEVLIPAQNQPGVGLSYSDTDLSLSLDDFAGKFLKTAVIALASNVDATGISAATNGYTVNTTNTFGPTATGGGTFPGFTNLATPGGISLGGAPAAWVGNVLNSGVIGTANATQVFADAGSRLTEQLAPQDNQRYAVLSPAAKATTYPHLIVNFNPQKQVSEMFQNAIIGQFSGMDFYESVNIQQFVSGTWANTGVKVATTSANGDTSLALQNVGNNAVIVQGDQFTVAGIQSISPVNYQATGFLQVFTVTSTVTANATGAVVVAVAPAIQPNGQGQVITTGATSGGSVKFMGTPNTATQTNLAYHHDAIALAVAPLPMNLPGAEVETATDPDSGLSIRYTQQYSILTGTLMKKLDILFGWGVVRPSLGCLIRS